MRTWTKKHTKIAMSIIIICLIIFGSFMWRSTYTTEGFSAIVTDKQVVRSNIHEYHYIYFVGNKQLTQNGEQKTEANRIKVDINTFARYSIDDTIAIRKTTRYKYGLKDKIEYTKEGE